MENIGKYKQKISLIRQPFWKGDETHGHDGDLGALVFSLALGNQAELAPAALDGASSAVQLGISMAGVLCLWMGVMEVMQRSGLAEKLARLLKPVLGRLFPDFASDKGTMDTLAANVSANLLGLGNAATPLGLETARRMSRRTPGVAGDSHGRDVPPHRAEHGVHPADPDHGGGGQNGGRVRGTV